MTRLLMTLLCVVFAFGCQSVHQSPKAGLQGPASATLDLYRNPTSKDKIFVEARLADGKPRLFLVDTGSSLSTVSKDLAIELQLAVTPRPGQIVGIGGSTQWMGAVLPA